MTCGARTWVEPDQMVTCEREQGHDGKHQAHADFGLVGWRDPVCRLAMRAADAIEYTLSIESTREIVALLQAQLDALDPGAAIVEAERKMVEAWDTSETFRALHSLAGDKREALALQDRWFALCNDRRRTTDAWLALVEARAGGGVKHQVTLSAGGVPIWTGEATVDVACGSRRNMAPPPPQLPRSVSFTMSSQIVYRRVLVTGGRDYHDERVVARCLELLAPTHIIEGGAGGADTCARNIACRLGLGLETYPADWTRLGRRAGPERNARMLRDGKPDVVLALPGGDGTADMVHKARRAGVPVLTVREATRPQIRHAPPGFGWWLRDGDGMPRR